MLVCIGRNQALNNAEAAHIRLSVRHKYGKPQKSATLVYYFREMNCAAMLMHELLDWHKNRETGLSVLPCCCGRIQGGRSLKQALCVCVLRQRMLVVLINAVNAMR